MGSLQEMQKILRLKDEKIKDLEKQLAQKDELVAELRSQLDKYQSVMPTSPTAASFKSLQKSRQRALGISAEPASHHPDVQNAVLKSYPKSSRYVLVVLIFIRYEY